MNKTLYIQIKIGAEFLEGLDVTGLARPLITIANM